MTQTAASGPARANLRVEGLTKRFGDFVAVDNLSLEVREGEIFGFLGPNGAGKTTSISMMCGLIRCDAGQTWIYDQPVVGGAPEVRCRVGVCPQQVILWGRLTCIEQLEFVGQMYDVPRPVARSRAEALLATMGLSGKRDALARTLSGGMQRRLSIVMALVHEPDIVVLDEPEAGLDPQSRVLVRDYIKALATQHGKTVILTTHNMDEAERVADRVAIIDQGKLLVLDTPERLKHDVGEGDILEIRVDADPDTLSAQLVPALGDAFGRVSLDGDRLTFRARGIVERLPGLLEQLTALSLRPSDLRLRENTLEDVFISLTGRRLRE